MIHTPVDRCYSLNWPFDTGYLCSCGRTILGRHRVLKHFNGREPVYWRVDGKWVHKGWLMPEVPQ